MWPAAGSSSTALYAIDDFNQRVRRVDLARGVVTTLAGKGGQGCTDGPGESPLSRVVTLLLVAIPIAAC